MLILAMPANSEAASKLYHDYEFGMSRDEIFKDDQIYDCSEEFEKGALCLNEQKFIGEDVDIGFRFINEKLVTVILFTDFTEESYIAFTGALNSKFQLVTIESDDKKIDLIVQIKKFAEPVFLKNISDFEQQALANGSIKYTFIEDVEFNKLAKSSANAVDLIMKADSNTRAVEYIISEVDEDTVVGLIQFSAPKKVLQLIQEKSEQKYEDF